MHLSPTIDPAPLLMANAAIAIFGLLLAIGLPRFGGRWFAAMERVAGRLARRKALAVLVVGAAAPLIRLALLPWAPIPQAALHDEFSYLLAGETFASHRLTNSPPPMWVHFETFHEEFQPTYMSMYPPAQGLVLASGAILFRQPWFGVCLSVGAMCAAICWMLQGWFSPAWALYGSVLVVLRLGIFSYWMNSYWGGALAAAGGALVLGAMPRLMMRVRVRTALALAVGVAILANSRPFEGFLLSLPVAATLAVWLLGKNRPSGETFWKRLVLPALPVLLLTACAMGYYNWRVFGSPLTLPYTIDRATYAVAPYFLWQSPRPAPVYHHRELREFYVNYELGEFQQARTPAGFLRLLDTRILTILFFFLGPVLMLPLLGLPWIWPDRRRRFLIFASLFFFGGLLGCAFVRAHYLAPATALIFALVVQASRRLRWWHPGNQPVGAFLVRAVPGMCLVLCLVQVGWDVRHPAAAPSRNAVEHFLDLQPGRQLAIVRYSDRHNLFNEWVHNAADIDGSQIVWAREMDASGNQELLSYYKDRRAWLVEPDRQPPAVTPYPAAGAAVQAANRSGPGR